MCMKKYGIIMISIFAFILAGCGARNVNENAAVMADYLTNCSEKTRYGICDIDNNGCMELLIAENNSHADSVTILVVDNLNHKLIELGNYGSWGSMSYYPGGYILSGFTGQGIDETVIYKITDGKVSVVHKFWDNSGSVSDEYEYKVDDESVTEEKYYALYNQYTGNDGIYIGYDDFTPIDEYDVMYNTILNYMH